MNMNQVIVRRALYHMECVTHVATHSENQSMSVLMSRWLGQRPSQQPADSAKRHRNQALRVCLLMPMMRTIHG